MSAPIATLAHKGCPKPPFFWNWFRKTLRWPFLLTDGPVACLCEGVARAADAVLPDIQWLADQFNPATCETEYVDRFGAARGLTRHFRESETMWRRRVCAAHAWHRLAGRTLGMPVILAHYGYTGALMINRAAEGETALWAHFRAEVVTGEYPVSEEDWDLIRWILNETKPAKSILESLTIVLRARVKPRMAFGQASGEVVGIAPWSPKLRTGTNRQRIFLGRQEVESTLIRLKTV